MNAPRNFRAIVDNDLSEWTRGYYVAEGNGEHYIHNTAGQLRIKPETVGLFSGLRDTKGVAIYEGDIVKLDKSDFIDNETVVKVIYSRGYFGITPDDFEHEPLFLTARHSEVIGNIYENPELLK